MKKAPVPGHYGMLGYEAATKARAQGKAVPTGGSADYHARYDLDILRRQSQTFDRDNGLYRGIINRAVDNILGDGFALQARTSKKKTNEQLERLWHEWCKDPEVRGLHTWWSIERVVLRSVLVDGDIAALKTEDGRIQLIESERIATSKTALFDRPIVQGIELNPQGRPVAYYIAHYDRAGLVNSSAAERKNAENIELVASLERASQTRGLPAQVSNFPMFHRINDVCNSEAIAWQLLARFAIAISRENAATLGYGQSRQDPAKAGQQENTSPDRIQEFDEAIIFHAEKGESLRGIERNLPGANFPSSITMFIRLLGLPVGMPLELVLLDWSKTNYSSARAALEQAFRMFACWQRLLRQRFHAPIYRWKVMQWIAEGLVPDSPDILRHEWIVPSFPWIDQLKEAQAWGMRIDRGLSTQAEALKSVNRDRGEWLQARAAEIQDAIDTANEINEKNPNAGVDWRIFAGLVPNAAPAAAPESDANESQPPDEKPTDPEK
ncbi:MAG: phage portal protein [Planctomycetota bacterium]|nr:phage portal protein [Planctomycetota bacterium]